MSSNGWDNDTAALQLFSHLEGDALNVDRIGGRPISPLRIAGSVSRLPETV